MFELLVACLVAAVVTAAVSAYTLHKVRAMHLQIYRMQRFIEQLAWNEVPKMWRQTESFLSLNRELGLPADLTGTRQWAASPDFLLELTRHVRQANPERIVECGSGTSTVAVARALQQNGGGHIISLDHEAQFAELTRQRLSELGLTDFATVIHAPLAEQRLGDDLMKWYGAFELPWPEIDMIIVDGPPEQGGKRARYPAGPVLVTKLAPGGVVFMDDGGRPDERAIAMQWLDENPALHQETRPWFDKGLILIRHEA